MSSNTIFNTSIKFVYIVSLVLFARDLVIIFTFVLLSSIVSTNTLLILTWTFGVVAIYVYLSLYKEVFSTFATIMLLLLLFFGIPLNISFIRDFDNVMISQSQILTF